MMFIKCVILSKNHFTCNPMPKYYVTISSQQSTKVLNPFIYLPRANEDLKT